MSTGKLNNSCAGLDLTVCAFRLELILVVIDALGSQRARRRRCAVLIHINGSLLLEIVITVGIGGLKVRNRIAQRAAIPLVRVEVNGLGAVLRGDRIALDVVLKPHYLLRRKQIIERVFLNARGVVHLDELSIVDRKNTIGDLKLAQRNQRRGNLDCYDIAGLRLALFGMLNGDDQVRGGTSKCIGIDVAFGLHFQIVKRLAVVHDRCKVVDLHKVTQLIGERNVAGLMLAITAMDLCRVTSLDNASRDLFEDLLELVGAGCRLVVIGVFRTCAIVDDPLFTVALISNA